jgi:two-component system chemotaxis sensor kinase CheA
MNFKELLANEPVVIVEDNVELVETLRELLSELEVPVLTFTDPRKALSELRTLTPSLIFSDLNMEGMNGLELAREVRKQSLQIPIVLLTGFGTKEVAVEALGIGVNDLLDKPVQAEKFLTVTKNLLSIRCEFLEREKVELEAILDSFVEEGMDLMRGIDELLLRLSEPDLDRVVIDNLFRKIHSIKGAAGAVPFASHLARLGHSFESALDLVRKGQFQPQDDHVDLFLSSSDMVVSLLKLVGERTEPNKDLIAAVDALIDQLKSVKNIAADAQKSGSATQKGATARVPRAGAGGGEAAEGSEDSGLLVSHQKLDAFLKLSGEMTMVRNYFQLLTRDAKAEQDPDILFKRAEEMLRGFNKITESLQKNIMEIRQVQFQDVYSKLPRLVRSAAQECGKKVQLKTIGGHLSIDKNIAKDLAVVFSHMMRNSVDHGIESPQDRAVRKKPEEGFLAIETSISGGMITVEIRDDGAGIDPDKVFNRAVEKGLMEAGQRAQMKESDIFQILFLPGFSTAAKVTNISGRGVGMDVVKNLVTSHHGRVEIESTLGKGSCFRLVIPVPKSVMVENTILMKYEDLYFVVPQSDILNIGKTDQVVTQMVSGLRYFQFKGRTIPLMSFDELLQKRMMLNSEQVHEMSTVVLQHGDIAFGLLVHGTEGQLDAVVLPFDGMVGKVPGFKGTTLLGSDGIGYVLSAQQMSHLLKAFHQEQEAVA